MTIIELVTLAKYQLGSSAKLAEYLGLERHAPDTWLRGQHKPRPKHIIAMNKLVLKGYEYVA